MSQNPAGYTIQGSAIPRGNINADKAKAPKKLRTLEEFKALVQTPLLTSRYTVYFSPKNNASSNYFSQMLKTYTNKKSYPNDFLECKVSSISLPNYQIDSEVIYVGGSQLSVPSGHQKGNLDLTIINQGIEYNVIFGWLYKIYNGNKRHYAYFDDIAVNLFVVQYGVDGVWVLEHQYFDCTPYNTNLGQLSYDKANGAQTFTVSMNYFSTNVIYNENIDANKASLNNSTKKSYSFAIDYLEGINRNSPDNYETEKAKGMGTAGTFATLNAQKMLDPTM